MFLIIILEGKEYRWQCSSSMIPAVIQIKLVSFSESIKTPMINTKTYWRKILQGRHIKKKKNYNVTCETIYIGLINEREVACTSPVLLYLFI